MPTYEYVCKDCGNTFDCQRSYKKADDQINCILCSSPKTRRALSRVFIHNENRSTSTGRSKCSGCASGSCNSCHH